MKIKVSTDFARAPGPRYTHEGHNSGQDFRKKILLPRLKDAMAKKEALEVDLDGTAGYGTSFLEESFGGLIREDGFNLRDLRNWLKLTSNEEPSLLMEIEDYMSDAQDEKGGE